MITVINITISAMETIPSSETSAVEVRHGSTIPSVPTSRMMVSTMSWTLMRLSKFTVYHKKPRAGLV